MKRVALNWLYVLFLTYTTFSYTKFSSIVNNKAKSVEYANFTFYLYNDLSEEIISDIIDKLNINYERAISDLGLLNINKGTVRIWRDESNFLEDMKLNFGDSYYGAGGWVKSDNDNRILYSKSRTDQLVHKEFCHAFSLTQNSNFTNNPRWFWEALAIYENNESADPQSISYLVTGNFLTLIKFGTDYNSSNNSIYDVGYLLSKYIIET